MGAILNPHVLRVKREARGWDQATLARMAHIDPSVVSRLERGLQEDLRVSVLLALARTLATTLDSLLVREMGLPAAALIPELQAVIGELPVLSERQQRQVAAMLRAYLGAAQE